MDCELEWEGFDPMERHDWVPTGETAKVEGWFELVERRKVERRWVDLSKRERRIDWSLMVVVEASRTDLGGRDTED